MKLKKAACHVSSNVAARCDGCGVYCADLVHMPEDARGFYCALCCAVCRLATNDREPEAK